jgi:hypothetical protein
MSFYRGTPVDDFDPRCPWKSLRSKLEPIIEPKLRKDSEEREQRERDEKQQRGRWITAIHESSHAGAFFWIGDGLRGAALGDRVRDRRYGGTCTTKRNASSDADQIMALLAGEASEKAFSNIDHGQFQLPWLCGERGSLPRMSTDRLDAALAAARISKDDDEIMRLIEHGWERALQFVRQHEEAIRNFAAWLNRAGELSGLQSEIFWNNIFPHIKNPPRHIVYPAGREPIFADLARVDGWIGQRVWG